MSVCLASFIHRECDAQKKQTNKSHFVHIQEEKIIGMELLMNGQLNFPNFHFFLFSMFGYIIIAVLLWAAVTISYKHIKINLFTS